MNLTNAQWRKSTRSNANGQCVEVADNLPDVIAIRDSKDPSGPILDLSVDAWIRFLDDTRLGRFDLT